MHAVYLSFKWQEAFANFHYLMAFYKSTSKETLFLCLFTAALYVFTMDDQFTCVMGRRGLLVVLEFLSAVRIDKLLQFDKYCSKLGKKKKIDKEKLLRKHTYDPMEYVFSHL